MSSETKFTNPKDAIGSGKLPLHLWPPSATALGCLGFLDGALKYGRSNWRPTGARASIYVGAALRHLQAWYEGEDNALDSGIPHLGHALACLAIIVDAQAAGKLVDDRQYPGGYAALVEQLTSHVARLKEMHKGKDPRHYTIADRVVVAPLDVVNVVVGVIIRKGKIFLQRRPSDDENFGGYWECPGGGVEPGETDEEALKRELREELGVDLLPASLTVPFLLWRGQISGYNGRHFDFRFYGVGIEGRPKALDGQPHIGWFPLKKVYGMALTPANLLAWPTIQKMTAKKRGTR
jgi:8-oxo-dGTP pyrophosphatase MutT (NUDIX family)